MSRPFSGTAKRAQGLCGELSRESFVRGADVPRKSDSTYGLSFFKSLARVFSISSLLSLVTSITVTSSRAFTF